MLRRTVASASVSMLFVAPAVLGAPQALAPPPPIAWRTHVANSGDQSAVDACPGGLTRWYEDVDGKPYYPIHLRCGGTPVLDLDRGDGVLIDGRTWVVTDARDVLKGARYSAAAGLTGRILVQTCYHDDRMRVVALTPR